MTDSQPKSAANGQNLDAGNAAHENEAAASRQLSPELQEKLEQVRDRLAMSFSKVVLALMAVPRYRQLPIAELDSLVLQPLLRDRIAIASAKAGDTPSNAAEGATVGIAVWAKVSQQASDRIAEQAREGVFPVRLANDEWDSGDIVWLLDVIAPNRKLATSVLASFGQIAGDEPVHIHPVIGRMVDPELLQKLKRPATSEQEQTSAG